MKSRSFPRLHLWIAALALVVLASLVLVALVALSPRSHEAQQPPHVAFDPHAWAVEIEPERLAYDRPAIDPQIKQAMNLARGRPPVVEGDVPGSRRDWFWFQRSFPLDKVPPDANLKALEYVQAEMQAQSMQQTWEELGPAPINDGLIGLHHCTQTDCGAWRTTVSGRTKAIVFNPNNPSIIYVATATGGIWKSTNGGNSYVPLTDDQPTMSFHSLALDPNNPNIVYAGSGEISGYYGIGILKSTNGGQTWDLLGRNVFEGLAVVSIVIDPNNSNRIHVGTSAAIQGGFQEGKVTPERGVFRSTNGGQTWTPLLTCSDCSGTSDLVVEDTNPQVMYAAADAIGIFKTTDGGDNWGLLTNGLPDRGFGRIELGIGKGSGAGTIYAGYDARVNVGGQIRPWGIIFKSTDHGQSWTELRQAPNYCSTQCWYDNIIGVHPTNPNIVYIGGNMLPNDIAWAGIVFKSTDGGQNWQDTTPATAVNRMLHPDMHAITFHPNNPNEVWVGNDGGVFRTTNGGQTWESRNANLATLQFQNIGIHPTDPNIAFGGLQDNAKCKFDGTSWQGLDTGDGGYSEIDPFEPNIWYSTRYSQQGSGVSFQVNTKGGTAPLSDWEYRTQGMDPNDRVLFYAPFALDPASPGVLYVGTHRLYRTSNRGRAWQPISGDLTTQQYNTSAISTIAVAPGDPNTIYTGSADGVIAVTHNLGGSWADARGANTPGRFVSDIAVSKQSANTAYVVFNGFDTHTPQQPGHVFKTTNGGQSWSNISSNLPDVPALSIALDPDNPRTIYIGTDIGVFRSTNDGGSWTHHNEGLANVPVFDLEMNQTTRHLWAGTHGRGVFRLSLGGGQVATPTPTRPPLTSRLYVPIMLRASVGAPTRTPTLPASGPAPGDWQGDKTTFSVTSDQGDTWNMRLLVPVPGCANWVSQPGFARIQQNRFFFSVDLRQNGYWTNEGRFTSGTEATGTARFENMYFGTSCGTWSGTVNWTATWQGGGTDPTPTPTATPRPPTPTPPSTDGIHGQVRFQDLGIGDINLLLRQCPTSGSCDLETSKVAETTTDENGYYQFTGVPSLPAGNIYFVFYFNHNDGNNTPDDRFLWRWYGPDITSYSAGRSVAGGDFEINDVPLTSPRTERTTLPVTFAWNPRGLPGERYSWELFDLQTGATKCVSDPATGGSLELGEDNFLGVCNGSYGVEYGWFVWAIAGPAWDNNQGLGDSYYYATLTFDPSGGPTPTPTPTRTPALPTATPTPTSTPPTGPSISGQVTAAGAGVSGVTLQLLHCDLFDCDVERLTTSGAGGAYVFSDVNPLGSFESYRVRYVNGPNGGNAVNPNYLNFWFTGDITAVSAQAGAASVDLDIGDVVLQSPAHGSYDWLPQVFSWAARPVFGDYYSWTLSWYATEICRVDPPTTATTFTLDATGAQNCGLFANETYVWYVYVTDSPGFLDGVGASYYAREIAFQGAKGAREQRLPQAPRTGVGAAARGLPAGLIPEISPHILR